MGTWKGGWRWTSTSRCRRTNRFSSLRTPDCGFDFERKGLGTFDDPASAGSMFEFGAKTSISAKIGNSGQARVFVVEDGSSLKVRPALDAPMLPILGNRGARRLNLAQHILTLMYRRPSDMRRLQKRGFGCTRSNLWFRSASQFIKARSLCQSRHAIKAAIITIPVPKAANNETTVAMIATKVSVIKVHPDHVCVQTPP